MGFKTSSEPSSIFYPTVHMPESTIVRALEYVSQKLTANGIHIHLVVAEDALSCLLFRSRPTTQTISVIKATRLPPRSLRALSKAAEKAEKKFGLAPNWINTHLEDEIDYDCIDYVVHRSLLQNQIVFSSEGLTLVAVDLCFALKAKMEAYSRLLFAKDLEDAIVILRRLVIVYRGRPLTKGYIGRSYPRLDVSDQTLLRVNEGYEWQFGTRGIVGVNDEYIGWRREGIVDWNICPEDLGKEAFGTENGFNIYDQPPPETPQDQAFAAIFATRHDLYD